MKSKSATAQLVPTVVASWVLEDELDPVEPKFKVAPSHTLLHSVLKHELLLLDEDELEELLLLLLLDDDELEELLLLELELEELLELEDDELELEELLELELEELLELELEDLLELEELLLLLDDD